MIQCVKTTLSNVEYEYDYADEEDNTGLESTDEPYSKKLGDINFFPQNMTNTTNETSFAFATTIEPMKKEILNQERANSFKNWLDDKSEELHELNMNYSGFNLLNETYDKFLKKDAKFAWINFTDMIMNISETISEVLYNKTLLVKDLSERVEKAYDEYQDNNETIQKSLNFTYYDAKSPKTFCDMAELLKKSHGKKLHIKGASKADTK